MRLAVWGGKTALIVMVLVPLGVSSTALSTTATHSFEPAGGRADVGANRLQSVAADSTSERKIRDQGKRP